jgi:multicomponent Na+:H+ antiporter subunit D
MNWDNWLPPLVLLTSLLTGIVIFFLGEERRTARTVLNISAAVAKLVIVGVMLWGVFHGHQYDVHFPVLPGLDFALRADAMAMFFSVLSAGLWLVTTIYAIGYLEGSPNRSRFFGFFSLCVTATMGLALAENLFTFFIFYELLTLTTYPLVVHRGTEKAMRGGSTYLAYTLAGGAVLLIGAVWLYTLTGTLEFNGNDAIVNLGVEHHGALRVIFALLIAGLGVKAAIVPLHAWLPSAMVAPAPVSALLHAVAVVKAGAFGVVRVVYDLYGVEFARELGVTTPLLAAAVMTIIYGSLRALMQDDLKRRLAFSTVSQISYVVLGVAIVGPLATMGGLVHLVHQGIMKITLFFCAGNVAETLGIHRVSDMNGVGRRMPLTMGAFTIAAFGMMGVPPTAGFITKWYLGMGAIEGNQGWLIGVLVASGLLNAAYFLPILYAAWFKEGERRFQGKDGVQEPGWLLLGPTVTCGLLVLLTGLFAGAPFSPLEWVRLIVMGGFYR